MTDIPVMPHSRAAEEALLGAILIDPEILPRLSLQPDEFYLAKHSLIYAAMLELYRTDQQMDYVTICARLDAKKQLAEIGGPVEIARLIAATPTSMGAEGYAHIIHERAIRRRVIQAAQRLASSAFDMDSDLSGSVSAALDSLSTSIITDRRARHIQEYISAVYDEVEEAMQSPQDVFGIPTGFPDIDRVTYGLQRGEKLVLSGEPGVGKSVLAAQILINAAEAGHPGVLYELEMSGRQVVRRALSASSKQSGAGIPTQRMRQGKLSEEEIGAFAQAVERMGRLPIWISDASDLTTAEMRADLMRLIDQHGVELVVVDYEGLLGDEPARDDIARTKLISQRLHNIAKDLNLALISIGDMTKQGIIGEVRGKGAVAGAARALHDADQIIIMRKGDQPQVVRLTWEKVRDGDADRFVDLVRVQGFPMFGSVKR